MQALVCLPVHGTPGECYYNTLLCCDYFFIIKCGIACFICTMHVFEVRASSSSPRLPDFVSFKTSIAELAQA